MIGFAGLPDALQDHLFRDLVGTCLHHDYGIFSAGDNHVQLAFANFLIGRVDDVPAVFVGYPARPNGALKWYLGYRQSGGCTNHA